MPFTRALLLTATCAALLTACGGDDDSDSSAGTTAAPAASTLTAAEYAEQGNKLCAAYEVDAAAAQGQADPEDPAAILTENAELFSAMLDELEALQPPEDLAAQHDELIQNGRGIADSFGEMAAATEAGDDAAFQEASEKIEAANEPGNELATELGLTDCASD